MTDQPATTTSHPPAEDLVRWEKTAAWIVYGGLLLIAVGCVISSAWDWRLLPIASGLLTVIFGTLYFKRRVSAAEQQLESREAAVKSQLQELEQARDEFGEFKKAAEKELQARTLQVDRRNQDLSERFLAFHHATEIPLPIDLSEIDHEKEAELAEQDQQLLKLLERETKTFFEKIRSNAYAAQGSFDYRLLRDDMYDLAVSSARIYRPGTDNPLLETSAEKVSRALNRISLHLLVLLEQIPLDVKTYNVAKVYSTVRTAVKAYGAYKTVAPYLTHLSRGWYVSRLVAATNPVSLGLWWGASEIGKYGAKKAVSHYVNQQILALLGEAVRVVGFEIAGIYSERFRYRDANWIYAAELNNLLAEFPISREALLYALDEVGKLQFRNEYDRILLFRTLAAHRRVDVGIDPISVLSQVERSRVVERLEQAITQVVHGQTPERVQKWKEQLEKRMQAAVQVGGGAKNRSREEKRIDALICLGQLLASTKPIDHAELESLLETTTLGKALSAEQRAVAFSQLNELLHSPAQDRNLFPDLDPKEPAFEDFLADLVSLGCRVVPRTVSYEMTARELASYYRVAEEEFDRRLEEEYAQVLSEQLSPESGVRKPSGDVARACLLTDDGVPDTKLWTGITLEAVDGTKLRAEGGELALVGNQGAWRLVRTGEVPAVLWSGNSGLVAERVRGILNESCRLRGGAWRDAAPVEATAFQINGAITVGFEQFFQALLTDDSVVEAVKNK